MQLTKILKRNPREIAQGIIETMNKDAGNIDHVEIAGPGFINLFLRKDAMTSIIKEVLVEQDHYGQSDFGKGIKYNIEFVSANPTGDLHLGHAKGAAVGAVSYTHLDVYKRQFLFFKKNDLIGKIID